MRAFLTGGSGFVGRNLIRQLRARGDTVCALARSERAARVVRALGAEPVSGDLTDGPAMISGMTGCDVVFHAAATVEEWGPRESFWAVNVAGTASALHAASSAGVPRFVHVSTEAVMGDGTPLIDLDESRPLPARPLARYPHTKGEAERRVIGANGPALATVIVRPRLIWGNDDTSLMAALVAAVNDGRYLWIGGGRYLTSTTHVDNVCEGLVLAAESGVGGEVYYVSDGPPVEFRTFITELLATQGVDAGNKSVPRGLVAIVARASEWAWDTFGLRSTPPVTRFALEILGSPVTVNDAKARRELGYAGRVTREAGLADLRRRANAG